MLSMNCMQVLHNMFQGNPRSTTVTSELNGQLINVGKIHYIKHSIFVVRMERKTKMFSNFAYLARLNRFIPWKNNKQSCHLCTLL